MAEGRRTLEETWKWMRKEGNKLPTAKGGVPKLLDHHAGVERKKDFVDITFFRSVWEDADLSNLTFPRRFINRTGFENVSFRNTDLNQSFMCWNDFVGCDFTDADLTCCDMRASVFRGCSFQRCKLVGADVRQSSFDECDFTDADVTGLRVGEEAPEFATEQQGHDADFREDDGPEPKGG